MRMSDASANRLTDAKADAAVALVECAQTANASADRLTDAKANAAAAPVECERTSELAERSARARICQVK